MIELKNIFKYYTGPYGKTYILKDINLSIGQGEFVTIMGPSGAGKSTLLYILGMLEDASDGEYYFNEHAVHNIREKDRSGAASCPLANQ